MDIVIKIITAGIDTGPFNLFSNVDGFISAFDINISKAALLIGFATSNVPNGTTIVRVQSVNELCNNYAEIAVPFATTTTTTTLPITTTTTTTNVVAVDCRYAEITISPIDALDSDDGTIILFYTKCDGLSATKVLPDAGTYVNDICMLFGSIYALSYISEGVWKNAGNSSLTQTTNCL
jgi:hypothetical protein